MMCLGVLAAYAIYIATMSARWTARPEHYLDGGLAIPAWGHIFAGAGLALASLSLYDHLSLVAAYGLQANHLAVGLVLAAIAAALFQKRLWVAARLTGLRTLGDLIGSYYGSVTLRIFLLVILFVFTVPVSAVSLAEIGRIIEAATRGEVSGGIAVWATAFFLFLFSVIGGWRGVVYVLAAESVLLLALMVFIAVVAGTTFDSLAFAERGIATPAGILSDRIPGVIQFTDGIGKEVPQGGLWTTVAILSFALTTIGIVLSPAFSLLGISTRGRTPLAFTQVWMIGGLSAGLLLLLSPILGAEIATASAGGPPSLVGFADRLAAIDQMLGAAYLLLLVLSLQIAVAAFAMSGASAMTIELLDRYILPGMSGSSQRTAARVGLGFIYLAIALAASFAPLASAILAPLALSLTVQLIPALLGLCWLPWMTRGGVLSGLIIATIIVVFTEPAGLVAFERLFLELPWGRWPLTVHAAAWGLFFNLIIAVIISLVTRRREVDDGRRRLHETFEASYSVRIGGPALMTAKWSLTLIWLFLALGPGAILGNTIFTWSFGVEAPFGSRPSLMAWQIVAWLSGVLIVWWLAYRSQLSVTATVPSPSIGFGIPSARLRRAESPRWIAQGLGRLARRSDPASHRANRR
jgi:Na+/proline symporter